MAEHKPTGIVELFTDDSQIVALIKQADGTSKIQTIKAEQFSLNFAEKRGEIKELMRNISYNL